jgi:hypothetical protein
MVPVLHTFGCSFAYGLIRLPEDFVCERTGRQNQCENFGDILAQHMGTPHECHAQPASGNKQIACTIRQANISEDDFVIIAWSGVTRAFVWDTDGEPGYRTTNDDLPGFQNDWQQCIYETEVSIRSTADYLRNKGVKFLMISALQDFKQYDLIPEFTDSDYQSWNWVEYQMYNNSLMDVMLGTWLSPRCVKYNAANNTSGMTEYSFLLSKFNQGEVDRTLIADCDHPSQKGHDVIAQKLLPYVMNTFFPPDPEDDIISDTEDDADNSPDQ